MESQPALRSTVLCTGQKPTAQRIICRTSLGNSPIRVAHMEHHLLVDEWSADQGGMAIGVFTCSQSCLCVRPWRARPPRTDAICHLTLAAEQILARYCVWFCVRLGVRFSVRFGFRFVKNGYVLVRGITLMPRMFRGPCAGPPNARSSPRPSYFVG